MPTCTKVQLKGHMSISGFDDDGSKTATEFWQILFSGDLHSAVEAEGANDGTRVAPTRGSPHPYDSTRKCKRAEYRFNEENTRSKVICRAEYNDSFTTPSNPLDADPVIEWDFSESGQEPYFLDFSATPKPVLNSVGMMFQEFLQRETGSISVSYSVNVDPTTFSPTIGVTYHRAVNNDGITIDGQAIAADQAKMSGVRLGGVQIQNGVHYRVATYCIKLRASWDDVVDDRGFYEKDPSHAGQVILIDQGVNSHVENPTPWPLDGSGAKKTNRTDTPATLTFKPYKRIAWATLGLV